MAQHAGEGGTHSYLIEERVCFTKLINEHLTGDQDVKNVIPINPENDDIFPSMEDGIILCKLINLAQENTIDWRAVNKKKNMNVYQVKENLNLALNAARGIGIKLPGITALAFLEKKHHLISITMKDYQLWKKFNQGHIHFSFQ